MQVPVPARTYTLPLLLAIALAVAQPAQAGPPECNCNNLTSLQQDYRNAVALQAYFQTLAEYLQKFEADSLKAWGNMSKVRIDSLEEDATYRQTNPPGQVMEPVDGYGSGPPAVTMTPGTCTQPPNQLDAMENASPCKAMADAALNHEAFHRANCNRMGVKAYWKRLASDVALEEVEAYKAHAAELKNELRRVLDVSDVTYHGEWTLDMNIQGMAQYGYLYKTQSEDIGGATGGDRWTMTGKGTSRVNWTKAILAGKRCSPSGSVKTNYEAKMTTDGLTFDLEVDQLSTTGALAINCPGGGGGGQAAEASGGGKIATGLTVKAGDTLLPGDLGSEIRGILAGMGTVSVDGQRVFSVTCSTP